MAEYVTKEQVKEEILSWARCINNPDRLVTEDALYVIDALPSADVRPVVPGKWEVVDWVEYDGHGECVHYPKEGLCCTNCKNVFKKELLWEYNYCPNCGADMMVQRNG